MNNIQIIKMIQAMQNSVELLAEEDLTHTPIQIELGRLILDLKKLQKFVEINTIGNEVEYIFRDGLKMIGSLKTHENHCYYCAVRSREITIAIQENGWYTCSKCGYVWK